MHACYLEILILAKSNALKEKLNVKLRCCSVSLRREGREIEVEEEKALPWLEILHKFHTFGTQICLRQVF